MRKRLSLLQAQFWNHFSPNPPRDSCSCQAPGKGQGRDWAPEGKGPELRLCRTKTALEAEVGGLTTCELPSDITTLGPNTEDPF